MTGQERAQLRSIVQSPQWATVKQLAESLCIKTKVDVGVRDTEWDFLKDSLLAEGKVLGIKQFIQEVANEAHYGDE